MINSINEHEYQTIEIKPIPFLDLIIFETRFVRIEFVIA